GRVDEVHLHPAATPGRDEDCDSGRSAGDGRWKAPDADISRSAQRARDSTAVQRHEDDAARSTGGRGDSRRRGVLGAEPEVARGAGWDSSFPLSRELWDSSFPRKRELRDSSFPRKRESIWCRPISYCHRIQRPITWIPAFAGMTTGSITRIPAFAGMTTDRWIPKARINPRPAAGDDDYLYTPTAKRSNASFSSSSRTAGIVSSSRT